MESREEGSWTVRLGYRERNRQNRELPCTTSEDDYVHHNSQVEDDNREDSSYKLPRRRCGDGYTASWAIHIHPRKGRTKDEATLAVMLLPV
jgi:hypothetical protein